MVGTLRFSAFDPKTGGRQALAHSDGRPTHVTGIPIALQQTLVAQYTALCMQCPVPLKEVEVWRILEEMGLKREKDQEGLRVYSFHEFVPVPAPDPQKVEPLAHPVSIPSDAKEEKELAGSNQDINLQSAEGSEGDEGTSGKSEGATEAPTM